MCLENNSHKRTQLVKIQYEDEVDYALFNFMCFGVPLNDKWIKV